jgi:hypothetical protein
VTRGCYWRQIAVGWLNSRCDTGQTDAKNDAAWTVASERRLDANLTGRIKAQVSQPALAKTNKNYDEVPSPRALHLHGERVRVRGRSEFGPCKKHLTWSMCPPEQGAAPHPDPLPAKWRERETKAHLFVHGDGCLAQFPALENATLPQSAIKCQQHRRPAMAL